MGSGQRSLGCGMCRKRKIKCDQGRPKCSACIRSKFQCGDYPSEYAFQVHTADTYKQKARLKSKSSSQSCDSRTIPTSPSTKPETPETYEFIEDESLKKLRKHDSKSLRPRRGEDTKFHDFGMTPNGSPPFTLPLHISMLESPASYRMAVVAAMQKEYIPRLSTGLAKSGPQFENGPAATGLWLSSSFALLQSRAATPVLEDALLAMSIVFLARSLDKPLSGSGMVRYDACPIYSKALRRLQYELNNLDVNQESERLDACFLASFACAWYEMLGESSLENMRKHMAGVGALLRQLGIKRIKSQTALAVLAEYRMTNIWSCMQLRQANFLSSEEWLYRSWGPDDGRPFSRVQILLDIAFMIPPAMETYDRVVHGSHSIPIMEVEVERSIREQLTAMTAIESSITIWAGYKACTGQQKPTHWSSDNPYPEYFAYYNLSDALAWIYYYTVRMVALKQMIDMKNVLISREVYEEELLKAETIQNRTNLLICAEAIFASMEYFFEQGQGFAGPAVSMIPFMISYKYTAEALPYMLDAKPFQQRLSWCSMVREKYIALGFPV